MLTKDTLNINFEKDMLTMHIKVQSFFKKSILVYMEKISDNAINSFRSSSGNLAYTYLKGIETLLCKIDENTGNLEKLQTEINNYSIDSDTNNLDNFITTYNNDYIKYMEIISSNNLEIQNLLSNLLEYVKFDFSILSKTDLYNSLCTSSTEDSYSVHAEDSTTDIDTSIPLENTIIDIDTSIPLEDTIIDTDTSTQSESTETNSETEKLRENTLLISDIQQKVILPYYVSELENILKNNNNYKNIQDIIEKKYTVPISYYKNPAVARFKEAYSLVRKCSSGSIKEAFSLGLELFFKSDLNPAIITACKNIDELDIYLSCLDDNEPDKFQCFEIVYESFPTIKYKI